MANTTPIDAQRIEAYHENKFLGYVSRVAPKGTLVICYITAKAMKFNKKRAIAIKRSAEVSSICYTNEGIKLYPSKGDVTFKMVAVH